MLSKRTDPGLQLLQEKGLVRAHELAKAGIAGATLQHRLKSGTIVRISRGVYASPEKALNGHDQLAILSIKHPKMVFCLLTALQIHGLTTQSPHLIWIAITPNARAPKTSDPPLRIVRLTDPDAQVVMKPIDGVVSIRVTSIAKTVADCFKFRNKVGLDIALEALRDAWRHKKVTMDELWESAQLCRVANVMRPYLESLT